MINLSKRLKTAADFVLKQEVKKVIDVGCDHALLDIYLLQRNSNIKIIASDNKKAPLENARKNIEKYSFLNKIELCLKDGINNIDEDVDTIVISGMGAETILEILEKGESELSHVNRLIISSNNKYELLRKKIIKFNYFINDEIIVFEDNKYYIVMEFVKGNKKYTKKELYFGPILLAKKDKLFNNYFNERKKELKNIIEKIPDDNKKIKSIINELKILEKEI